MCRNIRTLYNFEPPATDEEVADVGAPVVGGLLGNLPCALDGFQREGAQVEDPRLRWAKSSIHGE